MYQLGATYTREDIHAGTGGSKQACLLTKDSMTVGVCFVPRMNPRGPNVILVGRGPMKQRAAELLAEYGNAVPVFKKRKTNAWEFLGNFKATRYLTSVSEVASYVEGSSRTDVAGVILLETVK